MEVWGIQSHGAANTLYELMTMKSDDQQGRHRLDMYLEDPLSIKTNVEGGKWFGDAEQREAPVPEAFRVLLAEMRALCLNVPTKQTVIDSGNQ